MKPTAFAAIAIHPQEDGQTYTPFFYVMNKGSDSLQSNHRPTQSCVKCHMNGLREISPRGFYPMAGETQLSAADKSKVDAINDGMQRYAEEDRLDFGYRDNQFKELKFDPRSIGPAFGDASDTQNFFSRLKEQVLGSRRTRNPEYILGKDGKSGCAFDSRSLDFRDALSRMDNNRHYQMSEKPSINGQLVAKAMGSCIDCHDGQTRSRLNMQIGRDSLTAKILNDESMPQNKQRHIWNLNADERIALVNCLVAESKDVRHKWIDSILASANCRIRRSACESAKATGSVNSVHSRIQEIGEAIPYRSNQ